MRGGFTFYLRNRGAPTCRALASACSPAPTTPTILNRVWGLRLTPQNPFKAGLSCSLLAFAVLMKMSVSQLRWIGVGLWILAACAGRSTRSKGFQQAVCPSHPVRVARSVQLSLTGKALAVPMLRGPSLLPNGR